MDGSVNSCRALFFDLGIFAKYSGLKPNLSKTQAFWAGSNTNDYGEGTIYSDFNFKWTEKLIVLGVAFANDDHDTYQENFESKLCAIESAMSSWKRRYITVRGKIVLIKTLLLPKLTHILVSLPNPCTEFMKRLKTILFHFIWGGRVDRLQRLSVCKPYLEGGLEMIDLETYVEALKATWIRRAIKSSHSWTYLFQEKTSGGECFWEMNGNSLSKFSKQMQNPFWADVLRAFASVSDGIIIETENINRCGLFYSNVTKFRATCINDWRRKGLCYISDIIDVEGQILTFQQLKQSFEIRGSYLDYLGLIRSLPHDWKSMTGKCRAMYPIIHPQVELMLSKEKGAKYLYDIILKEKNQNIEKLLGAVLGEQIWRNKLGRSI